MIFAILAVTACNDPAPVPVVEEDPAEKVLQDGRLALARGDAAGALGFFSNLAEYSDTECDVAYGLALAHVLDVLDLVDPFVVLAGLVQGADSVGEQFVSVGNFSPILFEAIAPIEAALARLRPPLKEVVSSKCIFDLFEGYPVVLGREESELYFSTRLGYQWDSAAARLMLGGLEFIQAAIDYVLAHSFSLGNQDADDLINDIQVAIAGASSDDLSRGSWVTAARLAGGLFDMNPLFLDFSISQSNRTRINLVDDDLRRGLTLFYNRASTSGEQGLIQDLLERNITDPDLSDNVFALLDDLDGRLSVGDTLYFGIREIVLGSFSAPDQNVGIATPSVSLFSVSVSGPLSIKFQPGIGDIGEAWRFMQEIIEILTDQMIAVDDPSAQWRRIGVQELNSVIFNLSPLAESIPQIPEFIEFDFVSYLTEPVPLRALVPYWYDPDTDTSTPDVFVIEGESFLPTTEPYVSTNDAEHFPDFFNFDTFLQSSISTLASSFPRFVTDFRTEKDLIKPNKYTAQPIPYIAWQDPTFKGAIYIDGNKIPDAVVGTDGFVLPDLWLFHRAVNGYLVWSARENGINQ